MTTTAVSAEYDLLTSQQREAVGRWLAGRMAERNPQILSEAIAFACEAYPTPVSCAWCDHERGVISPPGTSHTICERHAAQEVERAMEVLRKEAA